MTTNTHSKTAFQYILAAGITILCIRGATAFYTQFAPLAQGEAQTTQAQGAVPVSKTQRQQRAAQLVGGMGKSGKVRDIFSAPDGSTGVVIEAPEGTFIGWMVDGVDAVWVGAKFDSQGRNQTQQEMIARGYAQPTNTPAAQAQTERQPQASTANAINSAGLLKAATQSPGFMEGSAGPIWTIYLDGNCGFCTQLWRSLRNPIASGQLRVRWAPVAVIAPSSAAQAAALLQSDQPVLMMTQHAISGQQLPAANITPASQQHIDANNAMLRALNAGKAAATPTIVVPSADGARVITGLPPDLQALIRESRS